MSGLRGRYGPKCASYSSLWKYKCRNYKLFLSSQTTQVIDLTEIIEGKSFSAREEVG